MPNFLQVLTRNLVWKLVALAAAFLIWVGVANEPSLATIVTVPVEYNNFPKELEISSPIIDTINVEARGPSGQLRGLHDSRLAAVVDFGNVKSPGQRTFTLSSANLNLPRGIELVRTIPAQLRFTFDYHAVRELPVTVPFSGKIPSGYAVASVEVLPPALRIGGPKSQVENMAKLTADPFDVSNVTGDTEQTLSVFAGEPEVRILGAAQVRVKIHVAQRKH